MDKFKEIGILSLFMISPVLATLEIKKLKVTKSAVASGILRQDKKHKRFWFAYLQANQKGSASKAMTEYAEILLKKQTDGVRLFNKL